MSDGPITFCIFSFNRGNFLKNCVESIKQCIPQSDIIIFDDDSNDADTLAYLDSVASSCRVVGPETEGVKKHGGLYHNMNAALHICRDRRLVCFLQDDTQVVRPVEDSELQSVAKLFDEHKELGFVHPCFVRGSDPKKRSLTPLEGPENFLFFRKDTGQSAGIHYSDLVVFNPKRLIDAGWHFMQSEPDNDKQARETFGMMAYMWLPFAMWLPEAPAYRGKHKTFGLKLAERKKQAGFYPFKLWSDIDLANARATKERRLPIAEEYLQCFPHDPPKPWTYSPLSGLRFYKHLNNLEVAIRRLFKVFNRKPKSED